jgi:hypothetical protein
MASLPTLELNFYTDYPTHSPHLAQFRALSMRARPGTRDNAEQNTPSSQIAVTGRLEHQRQNGAENHQT